MYSIKKIYWNAKNVADLSGTKCIFYAAGQNGNGIEVVFGENVETIPAYAFGSGSSTSTYAKIVSVKIGKNVKSIGRYAFYYGMSLESIEIPNSVESIGEYAFYFCRNLKSAKIGNGVTSIGNLAFNCCSSLTKLDIPDNVLSIDNSTFSSCYGLTSLTIGSGVTSIGRSAFSGCSNLTEITIPENVTSIGTWAFSSCSKLEKINWNAKNVADFSSSNAVFYNAGKSGNGIEVIFGGGVETIPAYAFYPYSYSTGYSPNVISVTIGKDVINIGKYAFYDCSSLETVHYNGTEANWNKITIGASNDLLTNASRTYFAYINIYDKDGNKVIDTTQNMGETVDKSSITVPDGYILNLYKDKEMTEEYSLDTPISENLSLYADLIKFTGTKTTVSEDGKSFTIKPINIASGNTIILALYNGEEFVTMQSAVCSGTDIPFTVTDDYTTAKVMVWNDLDNIMPMCDVEIVK